MTTQTLLTSRLIKASALIADTKILLAQWNLATSVSENLQRARNENILGKASRARVEDVLKILRQRYFDDPQVGAALVTLVQSGAPSAWIDPLLYYYSVQNDDTLRKIVLEVIYPRSQRGYGDLDPELVSRNLQEWVASGKTTSAWGQETIQRVTRNAMAALRDFGVLQGKAVKSITPMYLPTEAFAWLAFEMARREASTEQILRSPDWQLFFLPVEGVERFFLEAHQERLLAYDAAGSVVRIEFPVSTLMEYAHVLAERTHP